MAHRTPAGTPMTVRRYVSHADAERNELDFWRRIPVPERVIRVWTLSQELWALSGEHYEPGLHRSVASIHRR